MPTEKPRIMITLDDDLKKLIEMYKYKNCIPSLSQAVIELIKKGVLVEDERLHNGQVYTGEEIQLINIFRRADYDLRSKVMDDLIHSVARNTFKHGRHKTEYSIADNTNQIGDVIALLELYRDAAPSKRTEVLNSLIEDFDIDDISNNVSFGDILVKDIGETEQLS